MINLESEVEDGGLKVFFLEPFCSSVDVGGYLNVTAAKDCKTPKQVNKQIKDQDQVTDQTDRTSENIQTKIIHCQKI